MIGRLRPVSELLSELESSCKYNLGEKLYARESVDVDLMLFFIPPFLHLIFIFILLRFSPPPPLPTGE